MEAAAAAGLTEIDHLITTHWHLDHFGAMPDLAARIPIRNYIDHGPNMEDNAESVEFLGLIYGSLVRKATRTIVKPGDSVSMGGLDWRIVTSAGEVIKAPLPGAGARNPLCDSFIPKAKNDDGGIENAESVGSIVSFGKFRVAHLGDLTWNKEFDLMCPMNRVGTVDLLIVSNHGLLQSSSPVLVHGLAPRVAIMNNGARKGGPPDTMKTIFSSPGLENLWQLHFSLLGGQEYTVPGLFIANTLDDPPTTMPIAAAPQPARGVGGAPVHNGKAYWIKVSASADGSFIVSNPRTGFSKTYQAR